MAWRNYHQKDISKYRNDKVIIDGIRFDSKREAKRYKELKLLEKAGEIKDLKMQVKYLLIPSQREPGIVGKRGGIHKGKLIERDCSYIADFVYIRCADGETIVEDTKGMRTKDYIIKRKLMLFLYGIRIAEI